LGILHRAVDLTLGSRAVLVAVLPADAVPDAAALEGVDRDLKTLKEHPHPALLAAQDRLRDGARTLISFECIDGIPLAEAVSAQGRFCALLISFDYLDILLRHSIIRRAGTCTGSISTRDRFSFALLELILTARGGRFSRVLRQNGQRAKSGQIHWVRASSPILR
jgi:hypothetical protein